MDVSLLIWCTLNFEAYINRDTMYNTRGGSHIFFLANLDLKMVFTRCVIVDFICMGLLDLWEAWTRMICLVLELQNEKFLPIVGLEPGIS